MDFHEISVTGIGLTDFGIGKTAMDRASDPDADPIRNKVGPVDSIWNHFTLVSAGRDGGI